MSCQSYDEPISVTETFYGCEYTLTLDKSKYSLNDTIIATVTLENKSDKTVGLYATSAGHLLDGIDFYENNTLKYYYSQPTDESSVIRADILAPGDTLTYTRDFTPGMPVETMEPVADISAEWKIIASAYIIPDPPEDIANYPGDSNFENISLEIIVPH